MLAIYKRELKSYFQSMIGYVFIAFLALFVGIYFLAYNLNAGYPYFAYSLYSVLFIFIIAIPILTMKCFAEERKSKTDQLLLTSPISLTGIVLGKYFAMVTVFFIPIMLFCLYPLVIKMSGTAYLIVDYTAIFTFFLLGCVYISVGMFLSSLTESQIIAAISTFAVLVIMYMWDGILSLLPSNTVGTFLAEWLGKLELTGVLTDTFANRLLNVNGLILYISVIFICIFLTIQSIQKRIQLRYGTYNTAVAAIVIGIIIIINMIAGQFSESLGSIDLSDNKLYEITDTSKELITELEQEVTLRIFAEEGATDERIKTFVKKYAALSEKLTVEWIDPVLHPSTLEEYGAESDTIVVTCDETEKQEIIYFSDIIIYDYSSYYTSGYATESEFDAEGQLTSAVHAVTNAVSKKVYRTAGHGESYLSGTMTDLFDKSNFEITELNTLMQNEIPEDCDLLISYAPTTDFTEEEKGMISEYITNGGNVFLILGDTQKETPNLDALLAEFGMQKANGYIADTERCYQGNYYYIFPELTLYNDLTIGMSSEMVLLANALGVTEVEPARDTIVLTSFMTTSESGYAVDGENAVEGEYILGAVATEEEGKFTVITAASMIDSSITDYYTTLENTTLFMNAVTNHFDDVENISIEAKSLEVTYNTVQYAGLFGILFIFGIPVGVLVFGFVKWLKRRKA